MFLSGILKSLVIVLLFEVLLFQTGLSDCPAAAEIVPCTCDKDDSGLLSIYCEHPSIISIYDAIDAMSTMKLAADSIQVISTGAITLRENLFGNMVMNQVTFELENLKSINFNAFKNQEYSITYFELDKTKLSQIPVYAMTNLATLNTFIVTGNKYIEVVNSNLFKPLDIATKVVTVQLTSNGIKVVESNAFADIPYVKSIDLHGNAITSLNADIFPPKTKYLKELILW